MNKPPRSSVQAPFMRMPSDSRHFRAASCGPLGRRGFVGGALALAVGLAAPGTAQAATTSELLASINQARKGMKSLFAKFEQTRVVGLLAEAVKSKGELAVVLPSALRWELYAPDEVVYWITKDGVFYKSGKAAKATRAPATGGFNALLGDLVAFLGGDVKSLESRYELSASEESDKSVSLSAAPKDAALKKSVKRISVRTNPERWGIAKVVIEEPGGDSSTIGFEANQKDAAIAADKMKPPV